MAVNLSFVLDIQPCVVSNNVPVVASIFATKGERKYNHGEKAY